MTFKHGRNTAVWYGSADLSGYFNAADTSVDVDTADTTTYQAAWKTAIPGIAGGGIELGGLYDPAQIPTVEAALTAAADGVLTICPAGALAVGDRARLVPLRSTSYKETSPIGGAVAFKWSVLADGRIAFGYVLHLFAADTDTTTGATRDDTASSATGWTAHLHVSAVTAGSWVVKLQDASAANFSDAADITGASFTAATGATSQRLVSSSLTAAVRRYVRYVATRTGGAGTDSITFGLSFARSA